MTSARELRRAARSLLAEADVPSPQVDADLLMAHVLQVTRSTVALAGEVSAEQAEDYEALVRRRALREPLQHLTGRAPFRGFDLEVGPGVFVPRPETELLAGWVIDLLESGMAHGVGASDGTSAIPGARATGGIGATDEPRLVVDIGTGSGALALAVAVEVPGTTVVAVEPDPEAIVWARRNVERVSAALGNRVALVTLVRASARDLASGSADMPVAAGSASVVVSNPPYVPPQTAVAPEVRWDPEHAVFADSGGCAVIADVITAALRLLDTGGWLAVEHDETTAAAVRALLPTGQWSDVATHPDLAGRPRFTVARRRPGPVAGGAGS